jgi:hypothetical protein
VNRIFRLRRTAGPAIAAALSLVLLPVGFAAANGAASASTSVTRPCGTSRKPPRIYRHIVWIVMENKGYSQIIGSSNAPYINSLARMCGLASNFSAESHPSLPNYLAMTSGSTQGISDDDGPSSHRLAVRTIFSQLGKRWRAFAESMPSNCYSKDAGLYAVRHNPATYYTNIRRQCAAQDTPLPARVNLSARFTFVTPNLCHDMHSCPSTGDDDGAQTRVGDSWLSSWLPSLLSSPQYASGSTAIFITWDEDDPTASQHIATLVLSPSTPAGLVSARPFNHYSLLRTTEDLLGIRVHLGNAASAPSMRPAFHL